MLSLKPSCLLAFIVVGVLTCLTTGTPLPPTNNTTTKAHSTTTALAHRSYDSMLRTVKAYCAPYGTGTFGLPQDEHVYQTTLDLRRIAYCRVNSTRLSELYQEACGGGLVGSFSFSAEPEQVCQGAFGGTLSASLKCTVSLLKLQPLTLTCL